MLTSLTLLLDLFDKNVHHGSHLCLDLVHLAVDDPYHLGLVFFHFDVYFYLVFVHLAVDLCHLSLDFFCNIDIGDGVLLLSEDLHCLDYTKPLISLFIFVIHLKRKYNFVVVDQRCKPWTPDSTQNHESFFVQNGFILVFLDSLSLQQFIVWVRNYSNQEVQQDNDNYELVCPPNCPNQAFLGLWCCIKFRIIDISKRVFKDKDKHSKEPI